MVIVVSNCFSLMQFYLCTDFRESDDFFDRTEDDPIARFEYCVS